MKTGAASGNPCRIRCNSARFEQENTMQSTSASLFLSSCSLPQRQATNEWGNFHLKQPFGIFSEHGERLSSAQEAGHHVKLTSTA